MNFNLNSLVRKNIQTLKPYSSARDEFTGDANIFLDANENAFGSPVSFQFDGNTNIQFNRYPDPQQTSLKQRISEIKGIPLENIFLGNGSDEAIDLLIRIFCEPGIDNIIILPPTYGMYKVCADINNVGIKEVPLTNEFQIDLDALASAIDENTKIIFICSPNNPTGNSINKNDIEIVLNNFDGIVVIDEAYINYARQKTMLPALTEYPNLVIMQTLSKAWGLAALRLGMAFAGRPVIEYLNKVKYPYNISNASQQLALQALQNLDLVNRWTAETVQQREWLMNELQQFHFVQKIYPSDANFILVQVEAAKDLYTYLMQAGIIVRDRSNVILCDNCLRITIGTPDENRQLLDSLKGY